MVNNFNISDNGKALIEFVEGCKLTAYRDDAGVLTIGYGHTGKDVADGMSISQQQAEALLISDLKNAEFWVNKLVTISINQSQFDALCSFTFNEGNKRLQSSTLLKQLNLGNFSEVPKQFLRWKIVNGKDSKGLLNRRKREIALFQNTDWKNIKV